MGLISWSIFVAILGTILYLTATIKDFEPNAIKLTPARPLTGKLAQTEKNTLKNIEYLFEGQVHGPECQIIVNGAIYSTTCGGDIIKIVDGKIVRSLKLFKNPKCAANGCSVPLGIRHWKDETFVFVDGKLGVFSVDFKTGKFKQIFATGTALGDWGGSFPDDLDFIDKDTIIFSDISPKCGLAESAHCFLEMSRDGRLIKVNLNTGAYEIVADNILTPNGVLSHPDKQSVIVSSSTASQLLRVYHSGPRKGAVEVFADGLPGLPDNLQLTSTGKTLWIALYDSVVGGRPLYQKFHEYPMIRRLFTFYPNLLMPLSTLLAPTHAIIIEMDFDGNVVSSFHDTSGNLNGVTNVIDDGKYFYFGSEHLPYIRRALKP